MRHSTLTAPGNYAAASVPADGMHEATDDFDLKQVAVANRLHGLWRVMTGFRWLYGVAALSLGVATMARTASLFLLRYFVDQYLGAAMQSVALPLIALGFVGLALLQGGFTFLSGRLAARSAEGIVRRLRNYVLDHLQRLPFVYHDRTQTGELIQRATSDIDAIRRFFADQFIQSSRILFLFVINFGALLWLNWQLALISVIVIPVIVATSIFFFRRVSRAYEGYQEQEAILSSTLQENLSGIRVVKAFARQAHEIEKFDTVNAEKYRRGRHLVLMHSLYWPITDIISGMQMLGGFVVGALMAINGTITVGTYVAYAGIVLMIIWPIRNLGRLVVEMSRGLVSFERIASVIRQDREQLEEPGFAPSARLRGEIVFEQVEFAYENQASHSTPLEDAPVNGTPAEDHSYPRARRTVALQDISFHCAPGQSVALLGATGAGKSTLVNLLPRFYDYTGGRILLDGLELKAYSRAYLRQQIGMVEQEPFLFSRSVRENIAYGVERTISQAEIEAAARAAAIHDVIVTKLPRGYDTIIGEKGTTLSGGQKQRVAIARTLLRDPRILILDDSTSAVDTETEALIRRALRTLMQGRTTFIIAHRVQSLMDADLILVLDKGRIIQCGSHEELLAQDGMYRRIYAAQTQIEAELQAGLAEASEQ